MLPFYYHMLLQHELHDNCDAECEKCMKHCSTTGWGSGLVLNLLLSDGEHVVANMQQEHLHEPGADLPELDNPDAAVLFAILLFVTPVGEAAKKLSSRPCGSNRLTSNLLQFCPGVCGIREANKTGRAQLHEKTEALADTLHSKHKDRTASQLF
jgi:hypothetical protein